MNEVSLSHDKRGAAQQFESTIENSLKTMERENKMVWTRGPIIGAGAFGTVNMGLDCESGSLFAVKSVEVDIFPEKVMALEKEIQILSTISSNRVVKYLGTDWTAEDGVRRKNLLMEFVPGGSVADLSKNFGGKLQETLIRKYTRDILEGLRDLHVAGIVHCDIKGKNVLVGNDGAKLCDFGAAEFVDVLEQERLELESDSLPSTSATFRIDTSNVKSPRSPKLPSPRLLRSNSGRFPTGLTSKLRGTVCWMAPEVLQAPASTGPASDIWSLGCTVIEMATGDSPWGPTIGDACSALYRIGLSQALPEFPVDLSPEGHDFLSQCLQRDPSLRPTAEELLSHPFIREAFSAPIRNKDLEIDLSPSVSISPTSVLQANSDWDFPDTPVGMLPQTVRPKRNHRRSVSDIGLSLQNQKMKEMPSQETQFPSLAKLAAASSGDVNGLMPVKNPEKVKPLLRTQTAEEVVLKSYWSSPGSPQAIPGRWIAVHSPSVTPRAQSVADLSPRDDKGNLSWSESYEDEMSYATQSSFGDILRDLN